MTNSIRAAGAKSIEKPARSGDQFIPEQLMDALQSVREFIANPEMRLVLQIGAGLWLFIGVCALLGWVSMKQDTNLLDASQGASQNQQSLQAMQNMRTSQLLQAQRSRWRPGQHATGECGALQDSNMRRLGSSTVIQQFVDDAPPGYETPYRVQKY